MTQNRLLEPQTAKARRFSPATKLDCQLGGVGRERRALPPGVSHPWWEGPSAKLVVLLRTCLFLHFLLLLPAPLCVAKGRAAQRQLSFIHSLIHSFICPSFAQTSAHPLALLSICSFT